MNTIITKSDYISETKNRKKGNKKWPLRSGHLDTEDENKCGRKISYHIISRLGAMGIQKGRFECLKIQLSSQVAKFAG